MIRIKEYNIAKKPVTIKEDIVNFYGGYGSGKLAHAISTSREFSLPLLILYHLEDGMTYPDIVLREFISWFSKLYTEEKDIPYYPSYKIPLAELKDLDMPAFIVLVYFPESACETLFRLYRFLPRGSKMVFVTLKPLKFIEEKHEFTDLRLMDKIFQDANKDIISTPLPMEKLLPEILSKTPAEIVNALNFLCKFPFFHFNFLIPFKKTTLFYFAEFFQKRFPFYTKIQINPDSQEDFYFFHPRFKHLLCKYSFSQTSDAYQKGYKIAADILKKEGDWLHSFKYYLKAGCVNEAMEIIENREEEIFFGSDNKYLSHLQKYIPEKLAAEYPVFNLIKAGYLLLKDKYIDAENIVKIIHPKLNKQKRLICKLLEIKSKRFRGETERALEIAESIELPRDNLFLKGELLIELSALYLLTARFNKAEKVMWEALACFTKLHNLLKMGEIGNHIGYFFKYAKGEFKKALHYYSYLLRIEPPTELSLLGAYNMGDTYSLMGEHKEAEKMLIRLQELQSLFPNYRRGVYPFLLEGFIKLRQKKFGESIQVFLKALEKEPRSVTKASIFFNCALAAYLMQDIQKGEYFLEEAWKHRPKRKIAEYEWKMLKGVGEIIKGNYAEGEKILNKIVDKIKIWNQNIMATYFLEYAKSRMGKEHRLDEILNIIKKHKLAPYFLLE